MQKLKRDAGSAWTKDVISTTRLIGLCMSEKARHTSSQLVGGQLMGSLQQEAYARMLDDEGFEMRGEPLPDPPAFHGLMVAWDSLPTTVDLDDALLARMRDDEAEGSRNQALADAQQASAAVAKRAEVLESLDLPESPMEALALAERAFPDRLVVLDSARRSAEEFARGDAAEVWAVLRSMATVLHSMVFDRQGGNIVYAFQAQTGFELTLREMKLTKRASGTARLRTVSYHGQQHLAAAHVKGRGRARGESLRVHFFADYDERRLVIAHCGEHLTTYDTPSL